MTSNGSGAAEFDPQHQSIRQREKAGLAGGSGLKEAEARLSFRPFAAKFTLFSRH
jgi:hypothetical protein